MTILNYLHIGALIISPLLIILLPLWGYSAGMKVGKAGVYGSLCLMTGGALFFTYFTVYSSLEIVYYETDGMAGVLPGLISWLGILVFLIGVLWRLILGARNILNKRRATRIGLDSEKVVK